MEGSSGSSCIRQKDEETQRTTRQVATEPSTDRLQVLLFPIGEDVVHKGIERRRRVECFILQARRDPGSDEIADRKRIQTRKNRVGRSVTIGRSTDHSRKKGCGLRDGKKHGREGPCSDCKGVGDMDTLQLERTLGGSTRKDTRAFSKRRARRKAFQLGYLRFRR
jgi:hypothetical protein